MVLQVASARVRICAFLHISFEHKKGINDAQVNYCNAFVFLFFFKGLFVVGGGSPNLLAEKHSQHMNIKCL